MIGYQVPELKKKTDRFLIQNVPGVYVGSKYESGEYMLWDHNQPTKVQCFQFGKFFEQIDRVEFGGPDFHETSCISVDQIFLNPYLEDEVELEDCITGGNNE